jgi:membrane fusion protein, multidrug efflux system
VVDGDRVVHLQPVKLGPTDGERFAVLSGATVGAQVVVDGADKLRDGAKVTLASDVGRASGAPDRAPPASGPSSDGAQRGRRKGGSP